MNHASVDDADQHIACLYLASTRTSTVRLFANWCVLAGILDGLFCHIECLTVDLRQHILNIMQQMLESQQGRAAGLHLSAVVGIGRLLMHASDICADLGQTEQLVALLVQSYVQPDSSPKSMLSALCIVCLHLL